MNRFIRWYNKNRKMFWLIVVIAIIISSLPRILNEYAKDKKDVSSSIVNTTTSNNEDFAIITGEEVKEEIRKENKNIINDFVEFCNSGDIEKAYQLLSEECKEKLYPTIEEFEENYYNKIFDNIKTYSIQSWITEGNYYTYKVNLKEDILSTGKANKESIEEYYTIVEGSEEDKLNINNYIGNIPVNKNMEEDKIKIDIISKDVFMEYEIYNIKVINKTR